MPRLGWLTANLCILLSCSACDFLREPPPPSGSNIIGSNPRARYYGKISSLGFEEFFCLQQSGSLLLLDARPSYFYGIGHIPGAIHFPTGDDLDERIENALPVLKQALEDQKTIVVYCSGYGCRDARTLSRHISRHKLPVSVFGGGWRAWKKAGAPFKSASH